MWQLVANGQRNRRYRCRGRGPARAPLPVDRSHHRIPAVEGTSSVRRARGRRSRMAALRAGAAASGRIAGPAAYCTRVDRRRMQIQNSLSAGIVGFKKRYLIVLNLVLPGLCMSSFMLLPRPYSYQSTLDGCTVPGTYTRYMFVMYEY
eukprot:SAG31_NODE_558_length_14153_cov_9.068094_8_plen_148_part_00